MLNTTDRLLLGLIIFLMLCPSATHADVTHSGDYNFGGIASKLIYQNQTTESQVVFVTVCLSSGPETIQILVGSATPIPVGVAGCRGLSVSVNPSSDIAILNPTGIPAVGTYQISLIRGDKT
jgi:hypothetical protein